MFFSKKLIILSLISGILLTISWPVSGQSFFVFFGLIPLLFLEDFISKDKKQKKKNKTFLDTLFFPFLSGIYEPAGGL